MKLFSFNINGIRAHFHQLEAINALNYHVAYHGQKGHYGVALLTKSKPIAVTKGFASDPIDAQRRLLSVKLATDRGDITLINGYFPQGESRDHPQKFPAKEKFYADLQHYLSTMHTSEEFVVVMGDVNITPEDHDIGLKAENKKRWLRLGKCAFLPEERAWLSRLVDWGFFDTFRYHHPTCCDQFSWFDYRSSGFASNVGLRIDLILASTVMKPYACEAGIDYVIRAMDRPSDHAPIWAKFELTLVNDGSLYDALP